MRPAGRRPLRRAALWLAVLTPLFYASYGLANHLAAGRVEVPSIVFAWEHEVPFLAWTIFPYWSINVFYALALFLCRSRHELDRHCLRLLTAQAIAVTCFIVVPLHFSFGRPAAEGVAGSLFTALRGFDQPFNQAPSLHIALACILWDFYRRLIQGRAARLLLHAWTALICASVLTTFQHHFIDIPTGALLGLVCVWAWPLERRP
ncbi:MAG: phosphatase PAP2 family protein, partial [Pseudomonadota bacterium]|nr:phosphatase PAP2 family protein [Pseudomonadota bacterium]